MYIIIYYKPNPFLIVAGLGKPSFSHCDVPDTFSPKENLFTMVQMQVSTVYSATAEDCQHSRYKKKKE